MVFLGFGAGRRFVHAMLGLGLLMTAIYLYLYFGVWQVYAERWRPRIGGAWARSLGASGGRLA